MIGYWFPPVFARQACLVLAAALLGLAPGAVAQQTAHALADLERVALAHARAQTAGMRGRVEIEAIGLDPRTRLAPCSRAVAATAPGTRLWGRTSVLVHCKDPGGWSIHVPITVRVHAPVVVTTRALGRGERIGEADVTSRVMDLTRLPLGVLGDSGQAVGKTSVAALPAGTTLRPDMLRGAIIVTQGQQVKIVYVGEGFEVAGEGRALNNAAQHAPVQVKTRSGRVIKGIASEPGVVEVR